MEFDLGLQQVTSGMGTAREAAELGKAYERALRYLGERSVEYARAYTPVRTGKLRDGWRQISFCAAGWTAAGSFWMPAWKPWGKLMGCFYIFTAAARIFMNSPQCGPL